MPRSFDRDDHHMRRHGLHKRSEHNGWTNWDTWHVNLLIDNDPELHRTFHSRLWDWNEQSLRDWAIVNVIGPVNADQLEGAREWNEIPMEERFGTDEEYEDLRERAEGGAAWSLMGSPPEEHYKDVDPTNHLIDPEMVDWDEIIETHREDDPSRDDRCEECMAEGLYEQDGQKYCESCGAAQSNPIGPDEPGDTTFPSNWNA